MARLKDELPIILTHINRICLTTAKISHETANNKEEIISKKLMDAEYLMHKAREIIFELSHPEKITEFKKKCEKIYGKMSEKIKITGL